MKKRACIVLACVLLWSCGLVDDQSVDTERKLTNTLSVESSKSYQLFCIRIKWEVCQVVGILASFNVIDSKKANWLCRQKQDFICYGNSYDQETER